MPLKLRKFLRDLIDIMKEDYSQQLREIARDANGITCLQTLDNDLAVIRVFNSMITITNRARKKEINVRVHISRNCLFKILEGKQTLEEAFHAGELEVFGDPLTLIRCYTIWERVVSLSRTSPRFYFLTYRLR